MKRLILFAVIGVFTLSHSALLAQLSPVGQVALTFTPTQGDPILATASLVDEVLLADTVISLAESTEYELQISISDTNNIDITDQLLAQGDQFQFFYAAPEAVVADGPDYEDMDSLGLPIGLASILTSACVEAGAQDTLQLVLSNFMEKSDTSSASDGDTIFVTRFVVEIADDPEAPSCENEEEIITDVVLSWIPTAGGDTIVARAQDTDGEGPLDLEILDPISLSESTDYTLAISLRNEIEGEDITEEIMEEDDEHMFFFAFTEDIFAEPHGDGNIDNREDEVLYTDMDDNGLPVGLSTLWTTACVDGDSMGEFRVVLKHQPDIKTATSTSMDGGTDVDLTFTLSVADDPEAPPCENEEEIITDVILNWVPADGGDTIVARAQDPDGEGPLDLQILDDITLDESTEYTLGIIIRNEIEGEDITEEIMGEDDEHMFFFAFTEGIFADPTGDGNVDNREDSIRYNDFDDNDQPLGLSTTWTTATAMMDGDFRVVLKHQPGIKSQTTTANDGGTDIDLTWKINSAVTSNRDYRILEETKLTLMPNPVSSELRVELDQSVSRSGLKMQIIHSSGQVVYNRDGFTPWVSTDNLQSGMYFLRCLVGQKMVTKRFIKM